MDESGKSTGDGFCLIFSIYETSLNIESDKTVWYDNRN